MADLKQMKTSFLFIQLQSPSKCAERSQKAYSLAEPRTLFAVSRAACDTQRPDSPGREDTQPVCSNLKPQSGAYYTKGPAILGNEKTQPICCNFIRHTGAYNNQGTAYPGRGNARFACGNITSQPCETRTCAGTQGTQPKCGDFTRQAGNHAKKDAAYIERGYTQSACGGSKSQPSICNIDRQAYPVDGWCNPGTERLQPSCCDLRASRGKYVKKNPSCYQRNTQPPCSDIATQTSSALLPTDTAFSHLNNCKKGYPSAACAYVVPLVKSTDKPLLYDMGKKLKEEVADDNHKAAPEPSKVISCTNSSPSSCHRYVSSSWNAMDHQSGIKEERVWWKVEVCKPTVVKTPLLLKSPERKTFRDAVVEKSSRLTGYTGRTEGQLLATSYAMTVTTASPVKLQKAERYVWVSSTSAHSQNVAKAKYQFLFGEPMESTRDNASEVDDPGNTRLLPQAASVTNEFPEYGTTEHRENDCLGTGYLSEPTPCLGELKEPVMEKENLSVKSEPCEKENQKSQMEHFISDCVDTNGSSKPFMSSGETEPKVWPDDDSSRGQPSVHEGNTLDSSKANHSLFDQVKDLVVPSQEKVSQPLITAMVPTERKSYLYVEKELAAISEEETISLSESSLSQITEIVDFPKSQHSNIPVSDSNIPMGDVSPILRNGARNNTFGSFQVESTENAAIPSGDVSMVHLETEVSGKPFSSTMDGLQKDSLLSTDTSTVSGVVLRHFMSSME
ncbi:uncharacterized protein LOC128493243 [Spea bombifrons]|uniref:uncharacterized protein LOC128493243 n=1 Tax=Spea bombifrons TaxID=233779 RepID=UPI00234B6A0B|nr:uncharacterized protein LOC128493243 [Spea bombifrons]